MLIAFQIFALFGGPIAVMLVGYVIYWIQMSRLRN